MTEPQSIYCPGCANAVPFEKNFCAKCGMNISTHKQAAIKRVSAERQNAAANAAPGEQTHNARAEKPQAGSVQSASPESSGVASRSVRKNSVFNAFIYPFRGSGPLVLITFFILIVIDNFIRRTAFSLPAASLTVGIAYIFIKAAAGGYITLFFFSIIENSSSGKSEMPDWPDISGTWDLFSAALMTIILAALTILPIIIYLTLSAVYKAAPNERMYIAAAVWAALYYPMALMVLAETRNVAAIMPWTILMFIIRASWRYFIICFLIFLSFLPFAVIFATSVMAAKNSGYSLSSFASVIVTFLYFYGNIVMCRLLGVFCANLGVK